jgi:hypothetical protein
MSALQFGANSELIILRELKKDIGTGDTYESIAAQMDDVLQVSQSHPELRRRFGMRSI